MTDHLMQPTPKQLADWQSEYSHWFDRLRTAYAAGADAQLSADTEWVRHHHGGFAAHDLRAAMRPKPPSLSEQALAVLRKCDNGVFGHANSADIKLLSQALERLAELEGQQDG